MQQVAQVEPIIKVKQPGQGRQRDGPVAPLRDQRGSHRRIQGGVECGAPVFHALLHLTLGGVQSHAEEFMTHTVGVDALDFCSSDQYTKLTEETMAARGGSQAPKGCWRPQRLPRLRLRPLLLCCGCGSATLTKMGPATRLVT